MYKDMKYAEMLDRMLLIDTFFSLLGKYLFCQHACLFLTLFITEFQVAWSLLDAPSGNPI